jgi:hypothetical protein
VRAVIAVAVLSVLAIAVFGPGAIVNIPLTLVRMVTRAMNGSSVQPPQQLFSKTTAYSLLRDNESVASFGWEYNWTTANQVADTFATQIYLEQEFQNALTQQEHWDVVKGEPEGVVSGPSTIYVDSQVQSNHDLHVLVGLLFPSKSKWQEYWIYWYIQVNIHGEVNAVSGPFQESWDIIYTGPQPYNLG